MKILILTQPLIKNYGGILQNYALQTVLKQRGHTVVTLKTELYINCIDLYKQHFFRILSVCKRLLLFLLKGKNVGYIRCWLTSKESSICNKKITEFVNAKITTTPLITRKSELNKYLDYDAYVVGSDQVWRKEYSPHLPTYFLSFLPKNLNARRIAYAASFGTARINYIQKHIQRYSKWLQRFDAVSVRELSGKNICSEYFNVEAEVVPDPTMLLSADSYRGIIGEHKDCAKNKLVTYVLDETPAINALIENFATEHHLEIIKLRGTDSRKDLRSANPEKAGIEFWLGAIESAEYVITDSFHGTVFSLLFHKKFFSFVNCHRGKDRFDLLDEIFNIKSRFINPENATIAEFENLDFAVIEEKLADYRKIGEIFFQKSGL